MRKFILGVLGIAGIFLATNVYAAGTATAKFDTLTVGTTLTLGTANLEKVPVMTDNAGSKFDSGALALVSGSQTVTTSLTAVDRVFVEFDTGATGSATSFRYVRSGATFTITGYDPVTGATKTTSHDGNWLAIDE